MNAGYQAIAAEDWVLAKQNFSRAVTNAELGNMDDRVLSIAYYEYGRSSGVVCDWGGAEQGLTKSLELDRKSSGPIHFPLVELGRMYLDRTEYDKALTYFSEVVPVFEEMNADTVDPLGYADFLVEYATVLENVNPDDIGTEYRSRAKELRETFPKGKAHSERTPYGTACKTS